MHVHWNKCANEEALAKKGGAWKEDYTHDVELAERAAMLRL